MKSFFLKILHGYEYNSAIDWLLSLFPSFKYNTTFAIAAISVVSSGIERFFGLNGMAMIGFVMMMIVELVSGLMASSIKKETFSSARFSRFIFKLFTYSALIFAPFQMAEHYKGTHQDVTADIYSWLNTFLIMVIVFENLISILENVSVIDGKDKTHFIQKLKQKFDSLIA